MSSFNIYQVEWETFLVVLQLGVQNPEELKSEEARGTQAEKNKWKVAKWESMEVLKRVSLHITDTIRQ